MNRGPREDYFEMGFLSVSRWFTFGFGNSVYRQLKSKIQKYEERFKSPLDGIEEILPEQKKLVDACAWERVHGIDIGERAVRKVLERYGIHVPDLPERMQAGEKLVQWHFELRRRSYESLAAEFQTGNP